jgi:hypothetical protein
MATSSSRPIPGTFKSTTGTGRSISIGAEDELVQNGSSKAHSTVGLPISDLRGFMGSASETFNKLYF